MKPSFLQITIPYYKTHLQIIDKSRYSSDTKKSTRCFRNDSYQQRI